MHKYAKKASTDIGYRIRALRGARSQHEFASLLEITQDRLSKYESGRVTPPLGFLIRIAELTGKSLDWLILGVRVRRDAGGEQTLREILRQVREVWKEGNPQKKNLIALLLDELRIRT